MDEESVIARASYPCFQITVENRDYHNLPQNEIAECPIPRVPQVGPSDFIPDLSYTFPVLPTSVAPLRPGVTLYLANWHQTPKAR